MRFVYLWHLLAYKRNPPRHGALRGIVLRINLFNPKRINWLFLFFIKVKIEIQATGISKAILKSVT